MKSVLDRLKMERDDKARSLVHIGYVAGYGLRGVDLDSGAEHG